MPVSQDDFDRILGQVTGGTDSTSVASPVVVPDGPAPRLSSVPRNAFAAMAGVQNALPNVPGLHGISNTGHPMQQLRTGLAGLDMAPTALGGIADVASGGAGRAMGLSGAAAAGGEALREGGYRALGQGHMFTGGGRGLAARMALAGAGQSALTGTGRMVSGAIGAMAGPLREAPQALASKALHVPGQRGVALGNVGETMLRERVAPGLEGTFTGSAKTQALLSESHKAEEAIVEAADRAVNGRQVVSRTGHSIPFDRAASTRAGAAPGRPGVSMSEIADNAFRRIAGKQGVGMSSEARAEFKALSDELAGRLARTQDGVQNEALATPMDILKLKRTYDDRLTNLYGKLDAGKQGGVSAHIQQAWDKAVADEARSWLKANIKGIDSQLERTSKLLRYHKAMQYAESQRGPVITDMNPAKSLPKLLNTRRAMAESALHKRAGAPYAIASSRATPVLAGQLPRMVGGRFLTPGAQ